MGCPKARKIASLSTRKMGQQAEDGRKAYLEEKNAYELSQNAPLGARPPSPAAIARAKAEWGITE